MFGLVFEMNCAWKCCEFRPNDIELRNYFNSNYFEIVHNWVVNIWWMYDAYGCNWYVFIKRSDSKSLLYFMHYFPNAVKYKCQDLSQNFALKRLRCSFIVILCHLYSLKDNSYDVRLVIIAFMALYIFISTIATLTLYSVNLHYVHLHSMKSCQCNVDRLSPFLSLMRYRQCQ